MLPFKDKLLQFIDNGAEQAKNFVNTIDDIDWEAQIETISVQKDALLKKGGELFDEMIEAFKQMKESYSDFEIVLPYDRNKGEKMQYNVSDGKLHIKLTYKDDRRTKEQVESYEIPEGCDIEQLKVKVSDENKTVTFTIPRMKSSSTTPKSEDVGVTEGSVPTNSQIDDEMPVIRQGSNSRPVVE